MGKLKLQMQVTVDGFDTPKMDDDKLAGQPDAPWHEVARRISAAREVVFSNTLEAHAWRNAVLERGAPADAIGRLKRTGTKDIVAYGGVSFVSSLVAQGLVDEFHLFVNPVAAGKGMPVFAGLSTSHSASACGGRSPATIAWCCCTAT